MSMSSEELIKTLRQKVFEWGERENYHLTRDEYEAGLERGLFNKVCSEHQGSGVYAVTVMFEGRQYVCSVTK